MEKISRPLLLAAAIGFGAGVLWVLALRFALYTPESVHYHANMGVFINNEREMFESFTHYEEVTACSQDEASNPRGRIHMHQPDFDAVHVHDEATTWGNLFENMGLNLGNHTITTPKGTFVDGQGGQLTFVLNGNRTRSIANVVVRDQDRLLISFGDDESLINNQFSQIADTAAVFNETYDPAGCTSTDKATLSDRLDHTFSF